MKKSQRKPFNSAHLYVLLCTYAGAVRERGLRDAGLKGRDLRAMMVAEPGNQTPKQIYRTFNAVLRYVKRYAE